MNKDEIKKAFDICFSAQKSCNGCPLLVLEKQNGRGCKYNLFTSVFDIITEQEEEIERLKDDYAKLQELFAQYQIASDKEIIAQKKQAVKDFAGKVKGKSEMFLVAKGDGVYGEKPYVSIEKIDELLKEYE